jgi:Pyridoxamine 5'-phosphate oxidase
MAHGPHVSRLHLPDGYGLPPESRLLEWADVDARLAAASHYWICTVSRSMTPHPRPIDGMWLDQKLYFGGDPQSKWQRNLAANRAAAVHLDDPEHSVIAEGAVGRVRPDRALSERLVAASNDKYHMDQKVEDYDGQDLSVFTPSLVLAWNTLYEDATRFRFAG